MSHLLWRQTVDSGGGDGTESAPDPVGDALDCLALTAIEVGDVVVVRVLLRSSKHTGLDIAVTIPRVKARLHTV